MKALKFQPVNGDLIGNRAAAGTPLVPEAEP
jgi:hypothetical protein